LDFSKLDLSKLDFSKLDFSNIVFSKLDSPNLDIAKFQFSKNGFFKLGHIEHATRAMNLVTAGPISAFCARVRKWLHRTGRRQIQI